MAAIDELLASYSYDPEEAWGLYKEGFLKRPLANRDAELQAFDKFCEDRMSTPTRETSDLLQRKRELLSIHGMLRKLGR